MDLSSPSCFLQDTMRSSMPRPYYVVLFNHNVNVRLKQMKKNNRCKVTMTP